MLSFSLWLCRDDYRGGGSGGGGGGGGGYPAVPHGRGPPPVAPPNFRSKGSAHRVLVKGLPMSASWQDLKVRAPRLQVLDWVMVLCPVQILLRLEGSCACAMPQNSTTATLLHSIEAWV